MKVISFLFLVLSFSFLSAQNYEYKKYKYTWENEKPDVSKMTDAFSSEDLVVVDEKVKLNVIDRFTQTLTKNCIIKINNAKGIKSLSELKLPESFDIAADKYIASQGRESKTKVPYISKLKIIYYAARTLKKNGEIINIPLESKSEKVLWVDPDGLRIQDPSYLFINKDLEVGDIFEYTYQVEFQGRYGFNLFYFSNETPKQNTSFEIRYSPIHLFEDYEVINNSNGADSSLVITSIYDEIKSKKTWIYTYKFKDLNAINYPVNTRCGKELPHVFVDLNFLSFYGTNNTPYETLIYADRGSKFEWLFLGQNDSLGYQQPVYDQQHAAVRKFLTKFPVDANNDIYYRSLCDSLNAQKFVTAESMKYSSDMQYSLSSGEWLTRRKIIEEFMHELYWELLNEKKRTTYFVSVQDNRLGEIIFKKHGEYKYEHALFGVPDGKGIKLILPRYHGLKYNTDELPFYLEGVNAAVSGVHYEGFNLIRVTKAKDFQRLSKVINFIKTAGSSENENVRTESGEFKIDLDSAIIRVNLKENLNGQFSTIIRPLYFNDAVDSTVNPLYFKKCTAKPNATNIKIKSTYKSNTFPFKHSFSCSEDIILKGTNELPLVNWFSFTFDSSIKDLPNYNYYFDFRYSDVYNYLLKFNKPVNIENISDLTKSLNNKYFEIISNLVKQDENTYLVSVQVKVKQAMLPKEDGQLLVDFVRELNLLNNVILKIK